LASSGSISLTCGKIAEDESPDVPFAEKPKVGKLQMDWLRSEDLKEEKT